MKDHKINSLDEGSMFTEISELFTFISLIYSIKKPEDEFHAYFTTYLKKHYGFMTFEQLESAFELNSMNHLDIFLPKTGSSPDNKIRNFSIPSLTKVLNAYMLYRKIGKSDDSTGDIYNPITDKVEPNGHIFTDQEKSEINSEWCDRIAMIFEKYRDEFEETTISTPLFTAKILAKHKALEYNDIDFSEKQITLKVGKYKADNPNEKLIYKTFDRIIQDQGHIEDYLKGQRQTLEMPY